MPTQTVPRQTSAQPVGLTEAFTKRWIAEVTQHLQGIPLPAPIEGLVSRMGRSKDDANLVRETVRRIPGYGIGRGVGIFRVSEAGTSAHAEQQNGDADSRTETGPRTSPETESASNLNPAFVTAIKKRLDVLFGPGGKGTQEGRVTLREFMTALGDSRKVVKEGISYALSRGLLPGYRMQRGRYAGIVKDTAPVPLTPGNNTSETPLRVFLR